MFKLLGVEAPRLGRALWTLGAQVSLQPAVISASMVSDFRDCKRKGAFSWLLHFPRKANAAAELGSRVHAVLEEYARHATPPDRNTREGNIARIMLKPLPPPGVGWPEQRFYLQHEGFVYTGFIDWPYYMPEEGVTIIDHKTTSDLKWAKSVEQLAEDPQANIYAAAAMTSFGVDAVNLLWNYGTTGSRPRNYPVRTRLHLPQVVEQFSSLKETAEEIVDLQQQRVDPFSLPANVDVCRKYGGCPFEDVCELSTTDKLRAMMSQDQQRNGAGLMAGVSQLAAYNQGMNGQQPQQQPQQPQQQGWAPPQQGWPPQQQQPSPQQSYDPQAASAHPPQGQMPHQPYPQQPGGGYPAPPQANPPPGYAAPAPTYPSQPLQGQPPQAPWGAQGAATGQPSSPPNPPEAQAGQLAAQTQHAAEEAASTKKKGASRKLTKKELTVEQEVYMLGVQGGFMRGVQDLSALVMYGRLALQAFREEFPAE